MGETIICFCRPARANTLNNEMEFQLCLPFCYGSTTVLWQTKNRFCSNRISSNIFCDIFGRPFLKRFTLCYRSIVCPVCNVGALWPNGWMDQDAGRPRAPDTLCQMENQLPLPKGAQPPIFGPYLLWPNGCMCQMGTQPPIFGPFLLWPNGWMHQHATWYGDRQQPRGLCQMGTRSPFPKMAEPPSTIFGPCLLWPNGWMDEDTTWYRSRPRRRHIVLDGFPALRERGTAAPLFLAQVYCGHGRPSQLLLSSCCTAHSRVSVYFTMSNYSEHSLLSG